MVGYKVVFKGTDNLYYLVWINHEHSIDAIRHINSMRPLDIKIKKFFSFYISYNRIYCASRMWNLLDSPHGMLGSEYLFAIERDNSGEHCTITQSER